MGFRPLFSGNKLGNQTVWLRQIRQALYPLPDGKGQDGDTSSRTGVKLVTVCKAFTELQASPRVAR